MGTGAEIGVLDLQGGVQEHLGHLNRLGVPGRRVKSAADFAGLAGLILPGGESTCLARLLRIFGLDTELRRVHAGGVPLWGTCAGAILLARDACEQTAPFGFIDVVLQRNAFGSQLDSFCLEALVPKVAASPIPLTFIRAPKIMRAGPDVTVLLELDGYIAAAENDTVLVTVFHPELTSSLAFHSYFARKCGLVPERDCRDGGVDPAWTSQSWMDFAAKVRLPAGGGNGSGPRAASVAG